MNRNSERGMTLIEILVSIVILAIGLLMLAGGSLVVTRNLTSSRLEMLATARAEAQLDELRAIAASTPVRCTSVDFATSAAPLTIGPITLSWRVDAGGSDRTVRIRTRYRLPGGRSQGDDTLTAVIGC